MQNQYFKMLGISLVICRHPDGKWLAVNECHNQGWWLPGGLVDPPESHYRAAVRETVEEAGIDVELKGILRVEYNISKDNYQRVKVVFYAEPKDPNQKPKSKPDGESLEARWVTVQDLVELSKGKPGLRGPELYDWARYIEAGGVIYPLSVLSLESSENKLVSPTEITEMNKLIRGPSKYFDSKEISEFLTAMKENDDSWFFAPGADAKVETLVDENGNSLLGLAIRQKNAAFIKFALLQAKESLFWTNSTSQNLLMLAVENYFDQKVFKNILNVVRKVGNWFLISKLFEEKDKNGLTVKSYIDAKVDIKDKLHEEVKTAFA